MGYGVPAAVGGGHPTTPDGERYYEVAKIEFVCSDMWEPYLKLIREHCSEALHILDRFHIVAKMNDAVDEIRAGEARRLARDGYSTLTTRTTATAQVRSTPTMKVATPWLPRNAMSAPCIAVAMRSPSDASSASPL
mgnify:CR=1 FL=1